MHGPENASTKELPTNFNIMIKTRILRVEIHLPNFSAPWQQTKKQASVKQLKSIENIYTASSIYS